MSFLTRAISIVSLSSIALFTTLPACTAKVQTACEEQSTTLACGKIKSCATGKGDSCTSTALELPDGRQFQCASCNDCAQAQSDAIAACAGTTTPATEQDAATTPDPTADAGEGTGDTP